MSKLIFYRCDICCPPFNRIDYGTLLDTASVEAFGWKKVYDGSGKTKHICCDCVEGGKTREDIKP